MRNVTLIPGDGIGPSISEATRRIIAATGAQISWEVEEAGIPAIEKFKDPLPQQVLDSISRNKVALKGPLTTPMGTGFRSMNVALRKEFDLYINLRPAKSMEGLRSHFVDVDLVVFRFFVFSLANTSFRIDTLGFSLILESRPLPFHLFLTWAVFPPFSLKILENDA